MVVIKAFAPGLVCRGHKFKRNEVNVTKEANCVQNGWHAAENPLDCLSYYSWNGKNEFYICEAGGDIHEDGSDSKISCTELLIGERLTLEKFVAKAIEYMIKHPNRKTNYHVKEQGKTDSYEKFIIVRGKRPQASGKKDDVLGFVLENDKKQIISVALQKVGKNGIEANTAYTIDSIGRVVKAGEVV